MRRREITSCENGRIAEILNDQEVLVPQAPRGEVSTSVWFWSILVASAPLVGLVLLCVWAFAEGTAKPVKANWAKATLLWVLISLALMLLLLLPLACGGMLAGMGDMMDMN